MAGPYLTPEHYLALEREAEFRHEYYKGHMYPKPGGSPWHAFIMTNLICELNNAFEQHPCFAVPGCLRVRCGPDGLYTYPDVVVGCGPPKLMDSEEDTLLNPLLLIEVLAPSTEAYDRGFKAQQYRTLESLQEYALVSQSEPRVEVFRRQSSGDWLLSESIGLEAMCRFDSVDCRIPLAEIYDKVSFDEELP